MVMFDKIPTWLKILLVICFPPLIIFYIGFMLLKPTIKYAAQENKLFQNLVNNPTKENASEYIELIRNKPTLTFLPDNNPSSWAVLREKWQIINHSSKIPAEMKKEIFGYLVSRGLYVNNSKIVNNYIEKEQTNDTV